MSTQTASPAPLLASTPAGSTVLAIIAPVGPLLMALCLFVMPYGTDDDIPTSAAKVMESPVAAQWGMLFIILSGVFGSIGSLTIAAGIRRGSSRFGAVAAAIAFTGWSVVAYQGPIAAIAAAPAAGLTIEQTLALVTDIDSQVQGMAYSALFVGVPAGILLLGVAALIAARRGRYPRWVAILLILCIPVVIGTGLMPGKVLAFGWLAVVAAYAAAGQVYAGRVRRSEPAG